MKELMILLLKGVGFGIIILLFDKILGTFPLTYIVSTLIALLVITIKYGNDE